jgi:hypothetical protein
MDSPLAVRVRNDGGDIWLPLPTTPALEWEDAVAELYEQILEIRNVIEPPIN